MSHRQPAISTAIPIKILASLNHNESIPSGLGQCAATMIAARLFNQREGQPTETTYGVTTTGTDWKFLKLAGNTLFIDLEDYYINQIDKILGILAIGCRG